MEEISIVAKELFRIGNWPVTNSLLLAVGVCALLIALGALLHGMLRMIPGKFQNLCELLAEEILTLMESVLGSREKAERFFPLVMTIFIFILASNWMGLLPIVGPLSLGGIPLFRSPAADLNFTIALAVISVVATNALGVMELGFTGHFSKFFTLKNPIYTFVGLLEFVSEFVKIVSFSFRLFGNVFAGEVLLLIVGSLMPYAAPLPFMGLELFVGFIQAFIFSMLTLVFVGMATAHQH